MCFLFVGFSGSSQVPCDSPFFQGTPIRFPRKCSFPRKCTHHLFLDRSRDICVLLDSGLFLGFVHTCMRHLFPDRSRDACVLFAFGLLRGLALFVLLHPFVFQLDEYANSFRARSCETADGFLLFRFFGSSQLFVM